MTDKKKPNLGKIATNFQKVADKFLKLEVISVYKLSDLMREDVKHGYAKMTPETLKRNIYELQQPNALTMDRIIKFIESKGYEVSGLELKKK